jgi:hypothetical protein
MANFVIRPNRSYPIVLIDLGLSKHYLSIRSQEMIQPRDHPGFVGSLYYISIHTHLGKKLGRRDDLFLWFYTFMKLFYGKLSWSPSFDKHQMEQAKLEINIV